MGGPSCLHSSGDKVSILGWMNICEYAKHANRSCPLTPYPRASISTLWRGLPVTARRSGLHGWQGAFCLSRQPSASYTDPRHPPLLLGSVWLSPGWVGKCWWQLTLRRPAPTGEMVVPLVTFGFFSKSFVKLLYTRSVPDLGVGRGAEPA